LVARCLAVRPDNKAKKVERFAAEAVTNNTDPAESAWLVTSIAKQAHAT